MPPYGHPSSAHKGHARMLIIRITEDESTSVPANSDTDGLPVFLGHCGVPHTVIHAALAHLPQLKTLLLCKPSEEAEWEIQESG
jgi:hypothetical protein